MQKSFEKAWLLKKNLTLILADSFIKNNNVYMTLVLKFLSCLNGKIFDFKRPPFRYCGILVAIDAYL